MTKQLSSDKRSGLVKVMGKAREACGAIVRELRANPETASQAVFEGRPAKELSQTFRSLGRDARRYETILKSASGEEQVHEELVNDMWTMADAVAILGWVYGNRALRELERPLRAGAGLGRARELFASAIQQLDLAGDILEQRLRASGRRK